MRCSDGAQFLSDNSRAYPRLGGCRDRWNNSGELFALPTSKSVLKCNVLHQIQYHACEPVWYWGILEGRGYRHDRGTCVVSGPTQFDNFRKCF